MKKPHDRRPWGLFCEVSCLEQGTAFRLPLRGLWTGQGCPWPTALFSFQMKWVEKSTHLEGEGCGGGPVPRQAGGCSWAEVRRPSGCRVWAHWACLYRRERVLAFGRHWCCHHCPLSSVRIRLTLADFCSLKYWPGTPTHHLALHSKLKNKTCRKRYFEFILVDEEDPGDCLYGISGKLRANHEAWTCPYSCSSTWYILQYEDQRFPFWQRLSWGF